MKLPIIDADGHVMEPFSLWQERLPERFREMAWRRTVTESGEEVRFAGRPTAFEWSVGSLCTPGGLTAAGSSTSISTARSIRVWPTRSVVSSSWTSRASG